LVIANATFLNFAAHVDLKLTYKRIGEAANAAPHTVQPFPLSIVQLTVQKLVTDKHVRFKPSIAFREDDRSGSQYVFIDTKRTRDDSYNETNLASDDEKVVDRELAKGLVSFKAT